MPGPQKPFYPILHIDTGRAWGGGQQQVLYLQRGLLDRGIPSLLVCAAESPLARKAASESGGVHEISMRGPNRLLAAVKIARLARFHGVRTIHMHSSHAHFLGLLAERLIGRDLHKVVSRMVAFQRTPNLRTKWKYLGHSVRYIAISHAVKRTLLLLGVPEEDISVVYSGIDVSRYSRCDAEKASRIAREIGITSGSFVVGAIGSLVPCKGHAVLIEAAATVVRSQANLVCLIVGEGPDRPHLESLVRANSLQGKVILVGQRREIPEFLSMMDLLVMPSLEEGLGLALLEAMAAGVPVIASNVGGMSEVVVHGETGVLVPPAQPQALAESLLALARDPKHRSVLAANARTRLNERFSRDSMVEGTLAVYRSLA
jgi:glycosyltransferase involved in cell wall biosynthesis